MALVPIDQLLYGMRTVESGGEKDPYRAVNSIGAHGAYQVMRANIGPWTREVFGRAMTPAEFLANPAAQDKVAAFRLERDMKKYGSWEAAASVWFSGQPDPTKTYSDGGNTVPQYITKVRAAMANWRGTGKTPAPSGSGTPTTMPAGTTTTPAGLVTAGIDGALAVMGASLNQMSKTFMAIGQVATFVLKLALPSTWVRIACGLLGGVFLLLGLLVLGREATRGSA